MTREDQIKKAAEIIAYGCSDELKAALIKDFPELAEDEDERTRKELLKEIEFIIPHDDETDSEGLILPSYHARIDRYKSYLEKQKEQKPAECIEFDNEFKNQVSHLLASVLNNEWEYDKEFVEYAAQQLLGYAKHEIQSAEWSAEDERMLSRCIKSVECSKMFAETETFKEAKGKEIDWLKSLRPQSHWKPSEEQMKALENVIKCELSAGLHTRAKILQTLQNDLKKL